MSWVAVAIGFTAAAGVSQAYGQYQQGKTQKQYYDYLAETSRMQGEYQKKMGMKQSQLLQDQAKAEGKKQKTEAAQILSMQRAALAANGIDLSSVSAMDLASDSISKARADELALRFNSAAKSWSIETDATYQKWSKDTEASGYSMAGKQAKRAGKQQAFTTLLGTAASVGLMATAPTTPKKTP